MKKIILMMIIVAFMFTGSVFAEVFSSTGPTSTSLTGVIDDYRTSTNVTLVVLSSVSAYNAVSSHLNGDRVFGSGSSESVLYELIANKTAGTSYSKAPALTIDFGSNSLWESL